MFFIHPNKYMIWSATIYEQKLVEELGINSYN